MPEATLRPTFTPASMVAPQPTVPPRPQESGEGGTLDPQGLWRLKGLTSARLTIRVHISGTEAGEVVDAVLEGVYELAEPGGLHATSSYRGALLERRASDDEGDAVRDMLMQAGRAVAAATREALFGDAESAKEAQALAVVETALKATEADKRRRREVAIAEAERQAQQAKAAEARAAAERKREETARAEAERKAREAEAKKKAAEAEAKRKAMEAEAARREAEAQAARRKAEAEAQRKAEQAEIKRRAAEAAAQEAERIYVVKPGDTLSHIALAMYGNAGRWREIFEANRDIIDKPNLIRPGWKLRIPE